MELLLFRHYEFDKLYGCDGFNANKILLEERTNIVNGCILITLFFVFELLYIPCMVSIYKIMDNVCYKLMFFIGILNMLNMLISALETGILGIIGAVYCDYPLLIYTTGALGMALWFAETSAEMLLAINRCMELLRPQMAHALFSGNKLRCLFALPICYGFAVAMFTKPTLFSGIYLSWFFNPYVGYTDDFGKIYYSPLSIINDCFVIFGLSTIYIVFSAIHSWKIYIISSGLQIAQPSLTQKMTFLQVLIISLFHTITAVIYVSMQFAKINKIYIIVGTYAWVFVNGCPPLVYLLLNKRIRNDCANFGRSIFRFLRKGNNSVSNGPTAVALATQKNAGNNAISRNNNNVQQERSPNQK
ncbi:hypothetical protein niasHS_008381 [Heterodera schachtii]|uniref:Serpentine Receptor, class T n=1 Tax=Heterodera schachtii TaxID=97005 RepID=A0ABD2J0H8_HETSC